jgi:hypothetical protein
LVATSHVSNAYVTERMAPESFLVQISNVPDMCTLYGGDIPDDIRPVDDLWFHLSAIWFVEEVASTHLASASICIPIGESPSCSTSTGDRIYRTTGDGIMELGADRVHLDIEFIRDPDFEQHGPFRVELDLPIARCE